jgi:N-acetylmuramic acid 6-phosphate etherase
MQAATINAFFFGHVLQSAVHRTLKNFLSRKEMARIGYLDEYTLTENLSEFPSILKNIKDNLPALARISKLEAETYKSSHRVACFAQKGLLVALSDSTEISLDFSLPSIDTTEEINRNSWIQLWTAASGREESWQTLLGRDFRGLDPIHYEAPFSEVLADPRVKNMALDHLKLVGENQGLLYDFSLDSFNLTNRSPRTGDLGVCVLMDLEYEGLSDKSSYLRRFLSLLSGNSKNAALLFVNSRPENDLQKRIDNLPVSERITRDALVTVFVDSSNDPFTVNQQIALKILLNSLSTAVMADLGRIVGNTLTHIRPSSLKFIGQATYLIQSHVNDSLRNPLWIKSFGTRKLISFGEANAVLFENMRYLEEKNIQNESGSEVALSIIQILESLRLKTGVSQDEAYEIMKNKDLVSYLSEIMVQ